LPPAELAFHPAAGDQRQELYLMCDNIKQTVDELTERGVEFTGPITDAGWGRTTALRLPGGADVGLYEPRHPTAHDITPEAHRPPVVGSPLPDPGRRRPAKSYGTTPATVPVQVRSAAGLRSSCSSAQDHRGEPDQPAAVPPGLLGHPGLVGTLQPL